MSVLLSYNVSSVIESKSVEGSSVTVTNTADDTAGNQTTFFTLALTSEPVIPATITPHTSDTAESSFDVQQLDGCAEGGRQWRLMASGAD